MQVYLSVGGNEHGLIASRKLLQDAFEQLKSHPSIQKIYRAPFYQTTPIGMKEETQDFVNSVYALETTLPLRELFAYTQQIELNLGKIPKAKSASRPIDVDLLFYGEKIYQSKDLHIPHPRWKERLFVLIPLSVLTSYIIINEKNKPQKYYLSNLIASPSLKNQSIQPLEELKIYF